MHAADVVLDREKAMNWRIRIRRDRLEIKQEDGCGSLSRRALFSILPAAAFGCSGLWAGNGLRTIFVGGVDRSQLDRKSRCDVGGDVPIRLSEGPDSRWVKKLVEYSNTPWGTRSCRAAGAQLRACAPVSRHPSQHSPDHFQTLKEMRRATEVDPLNLMLRSEDAECCFWVRDYEQASECATQTLQLEPSFARAHFVLGRVFEAEGKIAKAIHEHERAGVITTGAQAALRAFAEDGAAGYPGWAVAAGVAAALHANALQHRPFFRARCHARLGEVDEAIRCLEEACEQRECLMVLLKVQEWWDPLRRDPRFGDLMSRVGIPPLRA